MRIARALALAGIASRRASEKLIQDGAVTVNGKVIRDLAFQVDSEKDAIAFRGRLLLFHRKVYYVLNKPVGYTTTASDRHAKKTIYDLLPKALVRGSRQPKENRIRVFPVGRLDRDSTGMILLTNDGELGHQLMHPRYEVSKWYLVRLNRPLMPQDKKALLEGIKLEDGKARAEKAQSVSRRVVKLMIREGRKREIRRMFEALEYGVVELHRFQIGPILLGEVPFGQGRYLNAREICALKEAAASKVS